MIDELVKFFILFFVVVEPITLVPLFAGLTEGADESFRRRMALKAHLSLATSVASEALLHTALPAHCLRITCFERPVQCLF